MNRREAMMNGSRSSHPFRLSLRAGELVEVRGIEEILQTLDESGTLEALPFMPEMLKFCGKQFRVYKRVDKTCDTIIRDGIRSMKNTVLLEGLRCDGSEHGGCQAECMIFWKEAWLKRPAKQVAKNQQNAERNSAGTCTVRTLYVKTRRGSDGTTEETVYSCQATEMRKATTPLSPWRLSQYFRDVWSGNVSIFVILKGLLIWLFNRAQSIRKGAYYPYIEGRLTKTPHVKLDLQPGELVRVLPKAEILKTLDGRNRNRGLTFDREMVRYCGGTYRVHKRVEKLLDEKTGKMMALPADCIILEGVICTGELNRFCPRAVFPYWKETWLRRVGEENP